MSHQQPQLTSKDDHSKSLNHISTLVDVMERICKILEQMSVVPLFYVYGKHLLLYAGVEIWICKVSSGPVNLK